MSQNKYWINPQGGYYCGDQMTPSDIEVTERPSPFHVWDGDSWTLDQEMAIKSVSQKAEELLEETELFAPYVSVVSNEEEWSAYRAALVEIIKNPTVDAVFPTKPEKLWV